MPSYVWVHNVKEPIGKLIEAAFFLVLCMLGGLIALIAIVWVLCGAVYAIAACIQGNPVQESIMSFRNWVKKRKNRRMVLDVEGDPPTYVRLEDLEVDLPEYSADNMGGV